MLQRDAHSTRLEASRLRRAISGCLALDILRTMSVRVLRNVVNYGALNGGSKALKLLALLALARALAPASFAVVAFAWGFVEVFRVVAIAGLDQWTTRTLV